MEENKKVEVYDISNIRRSRDSIKTAMSLVSSLTSNEKQNSIKEDLKVLHDTLVSINDSKLEDSYATKIPGVGKLIKNARNKNYSIKINKTKDLVEAMSLEITKKCEDLKEDDRNLGVAIVNIEDDIAHNSDIYEKMKTVIESIPGDEESELSNTEKASLVKACSDVGDLIASQSIQVANMKELRVQNMTVIRAMEHAIDKALISITNSVMISQHLEKRKELLELTDICTKAAGNMLLANAREISKQTDEFHNFLTNHGIDRDKVKEAIRITKQTTEKVSAFNATILPELIKRLEDNMEEVNDIKEIMTSNTLNVEKINNLLNKPKEDDSSFCKE